MHVARISVVADFTNEIDGHVQRSYLLGNKRGNKRDTSPLRVIHYEGRQRVDLADGQVDFAGNEHHHLAGGDDRGCR